MDEEKSKTLEDIWNQMHERLYRFIYKRLPDEKDAEDTLQQVFLRIHDHLESVRDVNRLESWVYQIARHSIADYYRSRRRETELPDLLAVEDERPPDGAAESLAPAIWDLVNSLPEPYREAIILTEYQGLSQKSLAVKLGISFSGAKSRVLRARLKIRDLLFCCCHLEFDTRGVICCYRPCCSSCDDEPVYL